MERVKHIYRKGMDQKEQKFYIIVCELNLITAILCHTWQLYILFCVESGW